ncbi:MAG TPA: outer membrane protein transport protein [Burkholderiales bacterium]|jgi:long-chain fatty acid transport protein
MRKLAICAAVAAALAPGLAHATDGYYQHGYGIKAKGRAGAGTAMAVDAFGGATNPAAMVFVGDRIDFGVDLFSPIREASRTGSAVGIDGQAESDSNFFLIPEFGYNKMISPSTSLGVTVYANGGMNTDYPGGQIAGGACAGFNPTPGPYNLLCGNGRLGVDLMQLVIAPTLAYKVSPSHGFGISPLIGIQSFAIEGAQAFAGFSTSPNDLTNKGHDTAYGYGVRVGWFGQLSSTVSAGAAYSTKIYMTEFDKYKGLFAEKGDFDMPENYNVGIAVKATPKLTVLADYRRINYEDIPSVGNPSAGLLQCAGGNTSYCLGGSNGAGFGWQNVNAYKLGFEYQYSNELTLRAGYSHNDNPIRAQDVTINILAPGVVEDHVALGFTYKRKSGGELTMYYMHAFENEVTGPSFFNNFTAPASSGTETIKMYQNSIGIAYGWRM